MASALTALAPVTPGQESALDTLLVATGRRVVERMNADGADPYERAAGGARVHFARLVLLPDPDRGAERKRLLLAADFDGELGEALRELDSELRLDACLAHCDGYPGSAAMADFLNERALRPDAFYQAFPDETTIRLRDIATLRSRFGDLLASPRAGEINDLAWSLHTGSPWWKRAAAVAAAVAWRLARLVRAVATAIAVAFRITVLVLRRGPLTTLRAGREVTASLGRYRVARVINRLLLNPAPQLEQPYTEMTPDVASTCTVTEPGDEVADNPVGWRTVPPTEDLITQNELTLVTVIRPGGERFTRAVLELIQIYARHLAPPGSLLGISTIHSVRWLVIDGGRRLVMISNYDGSWESYINEFAIMILSGLNAIWGRSRGFPQLGAADLPSFLRFLRCHQWHAGVFFSGCPHLTVKTLTRDREIAHGSARGLQVDGVARLFGRW